jgi:fructokinase
VEYSLRTCDALKLNSEELATVSGMFGLNGGRDRRLRLLAERFAIPAVCVTLGNEGSVLVRDGRFLAKHLRPQPAVDTVGAGDAFSACLAIGLLKNWPGDKVLDFASDLAAAICGLRGAVPDDPSFYIKFRENLT